MKLINEDPLLPLMLCYAVNENPGHNRNIVRCLTNFCSTDNLCEEENFLSLVVEKYSNLVCLKSTVSYTNKTPGKEWNDTANIYAVTYAGMWHMYINTTIEMWMKYRNLTGLYAQYHKDFQDKIDEYVKHNVTQVNIRKWIEELYIETENPLEILKYCLGTTTLPSGLE